MRPKRLQYGPPCGRINRRTFLADVGMGFAGLAVAFGSQNATARQFGIQELSTTVLTSTIVGIGVDSRLAGGRGQRGKLRFSVVLMMCAGAAVGATLSRFTVAPVIALVAGLVAAAAVIFWFGPPVGADD